MTYEKQHDGSYRVYQGHEGNTSFLIAVIRKRDNGDWVLTPKYSINLVELKNIVEFMEKLC